MFSLQCDEAWLTALKTASREEFKALYMQVKKTLRKRKHRAFLRLKKSTKTVSSKTEFDPYILGVPLLQSVQYLKLF